MIVGGVGVDDTVVTDDEGNTEDYWLLPTFEVSSDIVLYVHHLSGVRDRIDPHEKSFTLAPRPPISCLNGLVKDREIHLSVPMTRTSCCGSWLMCSLVKEKDFIISDQAYRNILLVNKIARLTRSERDQERYCHSSTDVCGLRPILDLIPNRDLACSRIERSTSNRGQSPDEAHSIFVLRLNQTSYAGGISHDHPRQQFV